MHREGIEHAGVYGRDRCLLDILLFCYLIRPLHSTVSHHTQQHSPTDYQEQKRWHPLLPRQAISSDIACVDFYQYRQVQQLCQSSLKMFETKTGKYYFIHIQKLQFWHVKSNSALGVTWQDSTLLQRWFWYTSLSNCCISSSDLFAHNPHCLQTTEWDPVSTSSPE